MRRFTARPAIAALTAGALIGALLMPAPAAADLPFLPDIPSPADLVRSMLNALFDLLFGDIPRKITGEVLRWLLTHPEFGEHSRFDTLERGAAHVRELAYALSLGFYCAGIIRHLGDDATGGAVEATRRFVFALIGITAWPWVFALAVRFSNLATEAFLEVPQLSDTSIALLGFAFIAGAATGISFICGLLAAVLLILLFLQKILVLTGLSVLYVVTPGLLAAYPFPPTSHLTGLAAGGLTALLVINPLWTSLIAVFALVGEGALTIGAAAVEDFIEPLIAIAMLVLVVGALPLLLRMAWIRGVTAALMSPAAGAGHGGGSAVTTLSVANQAAGNVRGVLEQRSQRQLQQSAWSLTSTSPGGATPFAAAALPAASGAASLAGRSGGPAADAGEGRSRLAPELPMTAPPPTGGQAPSSQRVTASPGPGEPASGAVPRPDRAPESPDPQLRLPLDADGRTPRRGS